MADAQHADSLRAWVITAQQIVGKRQRGVEQQYPPPPRDLTPEDCVAAGLTLADRFCARYVGDIDLHINFSPDLRHQTVFLVEPRPLRGARLWVDGRPVAVPINANGAPIVETLTRWLDQRFSRGALANIGTPARALSLWAWGSAAGHIAQQGKQSFMQSYANPPRELMPVDLKAIGYSFHHERSAYSFLDEKGRGTVRVDFSPDLQHHALSIKGDDDWSGALLWVDAAPVPVPRGQQGEPLCDPAAQWVDNRFVSVQIGGLWDHPLLNPSGFDPLGNIRGLLIWDVLRQQQHVEVPGSSESWTYPIVRQRDSTFCIYRDGDALKQNRPDRVLPIPV